MIIHCLVDLKLNGTLKQLIDSSSLHFQGLKLVLGLTKTAIRLPTHVGLHHIKLISWTRNCHSSIGRFNQRCHHEIIILILVLFGLFIGFHCAITNCNGTIEIKNDSHLLKSKYKIANYSNAAQIIIRKAHLFYSTSPRQLFCSKWPAKCSKSPQKHSADEKNPSVCESFSHQSFVFLFHTSSQGAEADTFPQHLSL